MPVQSVPPPEESSVSPCPVSHTAATLVILLVVLVIGIWLLLTPPGILGKADAIGYAVCHRIPRRSFHVHDRPLPLCARCTGIFLGTLLGLGTLAAAGRARADRLPPLRVIVILLLFGAAYALDGLNSYLSLFEAYQPVYAPHNTLRLLTGMGFGLALIVIMIPVFGMMIWRVPSGQPPLRGLRELAGLVGVGLVACGMVLSGQPALLFVAGLASAAGVVFMFGLIGTAMFLTLTRRENSVTRWSDLALPALVGLVFAFGIIGLIDLLRYAFTGTWEGFTML